MPERGGFTLTVLPRSGKKGWQADFSGWKLAMLRGGLILLAVLVASSIVVIALGLTSTAGMKRLAREVSGLQDSLEHVTELEIRLDAVQRELEEIREARRVIENLATLVPGADST